MRRLIVMLQTELDISEREDGFPWLHPGTQARTCTDAGLRPCTDSAHGADQPGDDGRGEQAEQDDRLPDVSHGDVVGICRLLANGLCGGFELLRTVVGGDLAGEQGEADVVPVLFHLGSDLAGGGSVAGLRGADHGGKLRQV